MRSTSTTLRLASALLIATAVLMLAACPQNRSIADITKDPGRFADKDVAIKGTVTQSFGAMGTGMYQVDDGTGTMWVFSQSRAVPGRGARVGVAGRVQPTFTFGGRSFATVLRETDRR